MPPKHLMVAGIMVWTCLAGILCWGEFHIVRFSLDNSHDWLTALFLICAGTAAMTLTLALAAAVMQPLLMMTYGVLAVASWLVSSLFTLLFRLCRYRKA